jgi:hypothetical protein
MKRRSRAGGEPTKAQRRKPPSSLCKGACVSLRAARDTPVPTPVRPRPPAPRRVLPGVASAFGFLIYLVLSLVRPHLPPTLPLANPLTHDAFPKRTFTVERFQSVSITRAPMADLKPA